MGNYILTSIDNRVDTSSCSRAPLCAYVRLQFIHFAHRQLQVDLIVRSIWLLSAITTQRFTIIYVYQPKKRRNKTSCRYTNRRENEWWRPQVEWTCYTKYVLLHRTPYGSGQRIAHSAVATWKKARAVLLHVGMICWSVYTLQSHGAIINEHSLKCGSKSKYKLTYYLFIIFAFFCRRDRHCCWNVRLRLSLWCSTLSQLFIGNTMMWPFSFSNEFVIFKTKKKKKMNVTDVNVHCMIFHSKRISAWADTGHATLVQFVKKKTETKTKTTSTEKTQN